MTNKNRIRSCLKLSDVPLSLQSEQLNIMSHSFSMILNFNVELMFLSFALDVV